MPDAGDLQDGHGLTCRNRPGRPRCTSTTRIADSRSTWKPHDLARALAPDRIVEIAQGGDRLPVDREDAGRRGRGRPGPRVLPPRGPSPRPRRRRPADRNRPRLARAGPETGRRSPSPRAAPGRGRWGWRGCSARPRTGRERRRPTSRPRASKSGAPASPGLTTVVMIAPDRACIPRRPRRAPPS